MGEFRWNQGPGDPSLFDPAVERVVGRGEYRGLEFLQVQAKRIINEVPASSRMPFRWTINAYRGCSHACAYCVWGETPILMGDGRTKPIADVRIGELVYGTQPVGRYRRYVKTEVLDHWSTMKQAYRMTLEDGTSLVASGDHRFLTHRGWKHVIGTGQGAGRRPHLTLNDQMVGTGAFARGPAPGAEYRRGYLCGMIRGDGHLGEYTYVDASGRHRHHYRFRLALADFEALRRAREYLAEERVGTHEFVFLEAVGRRRHMDAIRTSRADDYLAIEHLIAWPAHASLDWCKGFLAGIFDAEGSCSDSLRIANTGPEMVRWVAWCLSRLDFRFRIENRPRPRDVHNVRLLGGVREQLRFIFLTDPASTRKRSIEGTALKNQVRLGVAAIEPLGLDLPMYDITTGTGDFIANGVVSHNCFARPTHEYLNLDAGRDFETKIVVKVNAVELSRAETAPHRWPGESIAMGTNTDPYQPAEGKYKLTRGIVEVLAARANPFSILTKSSLVLRDLDLLVDAVRDAAIRVDFSVGTLDEEVWKATEPGTPHPRRRVEAMARLNAAGIPSGALIAPVLPGLSDRPEQLAEVVQACLDAGATFIAPILLHLRPGVRQQYLGWLEKARPDLLDMHLGMYRGSYPPRSDQDRLAATVRRLVGNGGGIAERHHRQPEPRRRRPEQLRLVL